MGGRRVSKKRIVGYLEARRKCKIIGNALEVEGITRLFLVGFFVCVLFCCFVFVGFFLIKVVITIKLQ